MSALLAASDLRLRSKNNSCAMIDNLNVISSFFYCFHDFDLGFINFFEVKFYLKNKNPKRNLENLSLWFSLSLLAKLN